MTFLSQSNIADPASTAVVFSESIKNMILAVYENKDNRVSPTMGKHGWFVCADIFNEATESGIYGAELDQIFNQNIADVSVMPIKDAVLPDEVQP